MRSLISELAFYRSYHLNKWNQLIHLFCVPSLLWSFLVWCAYLSASPEMWSADLGLLVVAVYGFYYLTLDVTVACAWLACLGVPLWIFANLMTVMVKRAWLWAVGVHVWSWYLQLHLGHGIFEKRRPAFMDAFFQSFMLAPLFVWYELLFSLGFCLDVKSQVEQHMKKSNQA